MTAMFPKSGPWAGDFQLVIGTVNPTEEGFNFVYGTSLGSNYTSTLQPQKTVDGGIINALDSNQPQAPLTSRTVTYSSSPTPNGSLQFTLTRGAAEYRVPFWGGWTCIGELRAREGLFTPTIWTECRANIPCQSLLNRDVYPQSVWQLPSEQFRTVNHSLHM
jgi:hypothetical protein